MVIRDVPVDSVSLADNSNSYVPAVVKLAVVFSAVGLLKVTGSGPFTLLQFTVIEALAGRMSFTTVPLCGTCLSVRMLVWDFPAKQPGVSLDVAMSMVKFFVSNNPAGSLATTVTFLGPKSPSVAAHTIFPVSDSIVISVGDWVSE